jgi:hypothetical protein
MGFRLMSAGTNLKFFSTNRSRGEARAARFFLSVQVASL